MAKTERRVAVDSCVIVNVLTSGGVDEPAWLPASQAVLRAAEAGQFEVTISTVTIAEVFGDGGTRGNHLTKDARRENIAAARTWLTEHRFLVVETDATLARKAAELAVEHQLKGADAIVLASAVRAGARHLCTWDDGLLKVGSLLDGLSVVSPADVPLERDLFGSITV